MTSAWGCGVGGARANAARQGWVRAAGGAQQPKTQSMPPHPQSKHAAWAGAAPSTSCKGLTAAARCGARTAGRAAGVAHRVCDLYGHHCQRQPGLEHHFRRLGVSLNVELCGAVAAVARLAVIGGCGWLLAVRCWQFWVVRSALQHEHAKLMGAAGLRWPRRAQPNAAARGRTGWAASPMTGPVLPTPSAPPCGRAACAAAGGVRGACASVKGARDLVDGGCRLENRAYRLPPHKPPPRAPRKASPLLPWSSHKRAPPPKSLAATPADPQPLPLAARQAKGALQEVPGSGTRHLAV